MYVCMYVCVYVGMCVCICMLYALYVHLVGFKEYEKKLYAVEFYQSVLEHSITRKAKVL